jgi:hypothetical protein
LEAVRQEPRQGAHRSVLEGFDRPLVLAHRLGGLGHGEPLQEAQHDALLLLGVELLDGGEQGDVGDVVDDGGLGAALGAAVLAVGVEDVAGGDLEGQAPRSRPCQVKLPMRLSARRNVSEVRSSASWRLPTRK